MSTAKNRKLQYLLIKQLLENGSVELLLPDGITLEIGILQEDQSGDLKKTEDYCYVVATRDKKSTMLDAFNLGLSFEPEDSTIVYQDDLVDKEGRLVRTLDIV